jgi:predicted PurR-regulated permease PerM
MSQLPSDLTRTTLAVLFIGGLILASFWIMRPFLAPLIWATMIVVSTWSLMVRAEKRLWGSRALAVTAMMLGLMLVFVVPLTMAIITIVEHAGEIVAWGKELGGFRLPPPPDWLRSLPLGDHAVVLWEKVAAESTRSLAAKAEPYAGAVTKWFIAEVGGFGVVFAQFLLTIILSAVLYVSGEAWARWMIRFGGRLAAVRGERAVILAGQAIRGVALGVVVTALVQSILGWHRTGDCRCALCRDADGGHVHALHCATRSRVRAAARGWLVVLERQQWLGHLPAGMDDLCWHHRQRHTSPFHPAGGRPVAAADFCRRHRRPAGFRLVGIFVGPVVLAVAYTLIDDWVKDDGKDEADTAAVSGPVEGQVTTDEMIK